MTTLFDRIKTYLDGALTLTGFTVIDGRKQRTASSNYVFVIFPGAASLLNIVSDDSELGRNFDWGVEIQAPTEAMLELAIEDITPLIIAYTDTNKRWNPIQIGETDVRYGVNTAIFGCAEFAEIAPGEY